MIAIETIDRPVTKRWLLCRERRTSAGIALDPLGLILHADTAEQAIKNAGVLFGKYGALVALPQEN